MIRLERARKYYQRAREIQSSSSSLLREFKQKIDAEIKAIRLDDRLTEKGKIEKIEEIKRKYGIELLQQSFRRKQEYLANLHLAMEEADAVVYAKLKKPDPEKLRRFENELRKLKTKLMLAPRADRAMEKLQAFVKRIEDAYLAQLVRDQFQDIASTILSAPGASNETKMELSHLFDNLKDNFESDEVREARQILETSRLMTQAPGFVIVPSSGVKTMGST